MKIFLEYLKYRLTTIILLVLFAVITAVVFNLYSLPVEAVLYSVVLCGSVGIIAFILGFLRYCSRHAFLAAQQQRITLSVEQLAQFPCRDLIENDYRALINAVHRDKIAIIYRTDNEKSEMINYYTLWAHQIKTPIAAMRLLLQSEPSAGSDELQSELFKIEQYVEMVLSYVRLGSATTDYLIKRYPLERIVKQAVRKYANQFIRKKITLELSELDFQALTDEKWLCFVIEQLLSNALKYTSHGSVSIHLDGEKLVIEDSGIGIRPEDLPRVFENGFTGYNGRNDKKSTGIGLYLCKKIIDRLGHAISIDSTLGQGTAVTIDLHSSGVIANP